MGSRAGVDRLAHGLNLVLTWFCRFPGDKAHWLVGTLMSTELSCQDCGVHEAETVPFWSFLGKFASPHSTISAGLHLGVS